MGYLVRCKGNAEKAQLCEYLRRKVGLSHRPTPFRTKGNSMHTVCIFDDHFYTAHWEDVDAVMEGQEMVEIKVSQLQEILL